MMMRCRLAAAYLAGLLVVGVFSATQAQPYWAAEMAAVRDTYKIRVSSSKLTVARLGDDITYTGAFFQPLWNNYQFTNATAEEGNALNWLHTVLLPDCWTWQDGPDANAQAHGCTNSATSAWPLARDQAWPARNIDTWLQNLKPDAAVILFGTNDLIFGNCPFSYKQRMRQIVQACKDYGTIPILVTIPPRVGYEAQTVGEYPNSGGTGARGTYVQAVIDLATELKVPLIDYNKEILDRRPTDWMTTLISSDGIHPSYPVDDGNPATEEWRDAYNFHTTNLSRYGYTLLNWMALRMLWDVDRTTAFYPAPGCLLPMKVYETAASDVPDPQPIRVFPIPASARNDPYMALAQYWADAQLVYDNWAEGLAFSTVGYPPYDSNVSLPIIKPNIAIHGLHQPFLGEPYVDSNADGNYDTGEPFTDMDGDGAYTPRKPVSPYSALVVDNTQRFYVTQEGSDGDPRQDNRFPYHVPRLARSHAEDYTGVLFDFSAQPVKLFGVFLPASSGNWTGDPPYVEDDQNFVKQDRSVYVTMLDETGWPIQLYRTLTVGGQATYCPFLALVYDGIHRIRMVSIIHDLAEATQNGVSFMDVYTVPEGSPPVVLPTTPANPRPANLAILPSRFGVLEWDAAGISFEVYLDTVNPPVRKVAGSRYSSCCGTNLLQDATTYYWQVVAIGTTGQTAGPVWSFRTRSPGDIDSSGCVNVGDLQLLVVAWTGHETPMTCNWNPAADANIDGHVNIGDLQLLVQDWGR